MVRVKLAPKQLGSALRRLGRDMDREIARGMVRAARYGAAQVQRTIATTRPRPVASGTYRGSWIVQKTGDGAILSSTALHAIFVELGRRPGRPPPVSAIEDWLALKKIGRGQERRQLALRIARSIGRRGVKGRYVLKRTMPRIAAQARVETAKAIKRAEARQ